MKRDDAIRILGSLEAALRSQGIAHLYLIGSVAGEEAQRWSDVDLAFDVQPDAAFDAFDQGRIREDLTEALGGPVDFVERDMLPPVITAHAQPELIQIF